MEKFRTILDAYLKHRNTLGYGLLSLLTAGGERLFSTVVFQCPCSATWNLAYGLVFLLVPALALFLLGCVLPARTGRLLTACCAQDARATCGAGLRWAPVCAHVCWAALLAPLTWVAVALLGGSFYECAASGNRFLARLVCSDLGPRCVEQLPLVPCQRAPEPDVQNLLNHLRAHSQILGWILIAAVMICVPVFVFIVRCRSSVSFMEMKFWKIYVEQEEKALKSQATEHAMELATENVKCFFEGSHPKELKIPSTKDWQGISLPYTFNAKEHFYSVLHKHVHNKDKMLSSNSSKGDEVVPAFAFVDAHGITATDEL